MYKRILIALIAAAMLLLPLSSVFASSESFQGQTETIMWDPDKAYNGYSLFGNLSGPAHLVDMEGNLINRWDVVGANCWLGWLLENGNLFVYGSNSLGISFTSASAFGFGSPNMLQEKDWDNNIVWEMKGFDGAPDPDDLTKYDNPSFSQHHDAQRMWNKDLGEWTYMLLAFVAKDQSDAEMLGADATYESNYTGGWTPDSLFEFRYNGDLVWFWSFPDHYITTNPSGQTLAESEFTDFAGRPNSAPVYVLSEDDFVNYPGRLNVNHIDYTPNNTPGPRPDQQHCNSFDYDEDTGYVCINAKACNEFFVIDHDGTFMTPAMMGEAYPNHFSDPNTAARNVEKVGSLARSSLGDFIYRFGMPANYNTSKSYPTWYNEEDAEMYGTHDIQFIEPYHWHTPGPNDTWPDPATFTAENVANPGAGNLMAFDNGCYNPTLAGSRILEINPHVNAAVETCTSGGYGGMTCTLERTIGPSDVWVDPATEGLPRRAHVVWEFEGGMNDFYSSFISGTDRMPNGNTIVCSGDTGHLFEVTNDGTVVWEYVNPRVSVGMGMDGAASYATKKVPGMSGSSFRFSRYGFNYPGLSGKDLTSQGTLTGRIPLAGDTYPDPEPAPTGWGTSGMSRGEGGSGAADAGGGGTGSY